MSLERDARLGKRYGIDNNDDEYTRRLSRHSRHRTHHGISMEEYELEDQDRGFLPLLHRSSQHSIAMNLAELENDDSFQKEVAEKSQKYLVGRQEASVECQIDRIVTREGDKDKALLYVVSKLTNENEVQVLINTLIHRGANPSAKNNELKTALHFAVEKNFRGVCSKLLQHDAIPNHRDRNRTMPVTIAIDNGNDTLAALLITYMSNEIVRELYTGDGSRQAEFSFHKLMEKNMQDTILAILDCLIQIQKPSGNVDVYYQLLDSDEQGRAPNQEHFDTTSKSPFQLIAKSGNKTLVYHDVVRLLIRRKWKEYARLKFALNSGFYIITLLALTFSAVAAVSTSNPSIYNSTIDYFRAVTEILTCIMTFLTLLSEVNQFRKHKLEYWHDPFNWLDMSSSILILAVIPLRFLQIKEQWPVLSVGFLLWTIRIFKYAAVFRQTGAYARVLWRIVTHDFPQFIFVFLVILLAFSGALVLSLKGEDSLNKHDETSSFFKIVFLGVRILTEAERIIEYAELRPMSCIIMLMFLFTCCVVLLNILIAQLSDTYQNVQQDAQRGLEVTRAWIIARVELNSMYFGKNSRAEHYKDKEHITDIKEVLEKWETPPLNEMNKYIQDINDSLDAHTMNLLTVRNRLSTLNKMQEQLDRLIQLQTRNKDADKDTDTDITMDIQPSGGQARESGTGYTIP